MSRSYIDKNKQTNTYNHNSEVNDKKIDPVAQLNWLNNLKVDRGWGVFGDNGETAQMLAEDEKYIVQKKEELQNTSNSFASIGSKTGVPENLKSKMEHSFGVDFSNIKIHQNSIQAKNMGALAYTQGNKVHFSPGQYNPKSSKGQELLGHELTHVVQQRQGKVNATKQSKGIAINDNPALEKEADEIGAKVAQGKAVEVLGKGKGIQKKTKGTTSNDAKKILTDFLTIFSDEKFKGFRNLLSVSLKGKSFEPMSKETSEKAFIDIKLNPDQQALVEMILNTINSEDIHEVEFAMGTDALSTNAKKHIELNKKLVEIYSKNGWTIPVSILGGSQTVKTKKGTYCLIVKDDPGPNDYFNTKENKKVKNPIGREGVTAHELIGHGRSLASGREDENQHEDAIRLENLVLRVMGHEDVQRDGTDHMLKTRIKDASKLPDYR